MVEQILVPFRAADQGRGAPSWGQRELWGVGGQEGRHITLGGVTALPPGTSVEAVIDVLSVLMARHATLRTRFHVAEGLRLRDQVLSSAGQVPLTVIDTDRPEEAACDAAIGFDRAKFDFGEEWPLRMAVIRHRGALTHMVAVYNHIALDARGLDAMLAGVAGGNGSSGTATPAARTTPPALEPLEQAAWQQSAAGRRQSTRALKHWGRILREAPTRHFRNQRTDVGAPYVRLVLESQAARLAARAICERTRQSAGYVLLAAYAVAVSRFSGSSVVALRVVVDNRFRPGLATSISSVSQMGLWSIDASAPTFDAVLARALTASLETYKNAYYDPVDRQSLIDSAGRERGEAIILDCCYNDRRREGSGPAQPASLVTPAALRELADRSVLRWEPWTALTVPEGETLYLHIDDTPDGRGLSFTVCADTAYLAPGEVEECARMIEDVLVQAAVGDPLSLR